MKFRMLNRGGIGVKKRTEEEKRRKRLLFVVEAMGGGVFTYIVNLTNRLVRDYDLYLAYAVRPQTPENYKEYFDPRIRMIEVKNFVRPIRLQKDFKAFLELMEIARRVQPDIIHLHSTKAGILGRLAYWNLGVPLFYTPHGYSFLMQQARRGKRVLYRTLEALMARVHCTTISCSLGEHQETLKLTRHARLVNNGIDMQEMRAYLDHCPASSTKEENGSRPFTVFTLGRICPQKNPAIFNQIAHAVSDIQFLWIGDGELRELLDAPNIQVTGWTDRKEALRLASQANCFLLVSLWEGLPISLLEAMYMKKPCIVSDAIGNHDVIHNGQNGFVCRTLDDYVTALRNVQKPEIVTQICARAYQDILNEYNAETMARHYEAIYEEDCGDVVTSTDPQLITGGVG